MVILLICIECGHNFEEPIHWKEKHGLDTPPYEECDGCPRCGGAYTEAHRCDCCDEWISDDYIKTEDGKRYCNDCITHMELGEEY